MEGARSFLESSTIHGLTHISTTRKYARLFWILVVITGFVGASIIIKESFDSWSESPVKTTIETLPIAEIKFPKVTICPPKNTFTDLNYDLILTENITLTKDMRDEMFKYALEVIDEDSFLENNWNKLHEENRFYNWYHGFTEIKSPYYEDAFGLLIDIDTSATSGVVTTQYYGEQFRPKLVERKPYYRIYVFPPENVRDNKNVTLHFKVEKVSMTGLASSSLDTVEIEWTELNADQTTAYTKFTPPIYYLEHRYVKLQRDVEDEDVETQKLDVMPGFRFTWWYTGIVAGVTPYDRYKNEKITRQFVG